MFVRLFKYIYYERLKVLFNQGSSDKLHIIVKIQHVEHYFCQQILVVTSRKIFIK